MLVAFSLLALSLSWLAYHRPPSTWLALVLRFVPASSPSTPAIPSTSPPSPQTTPKATPRPESNAPAVPTLTLDEHDSDDDDDEEEDSLPPPSFPAMNSAQRASGPASSLSMPPPAPKQNLMAPPKQNLMAPPKQSLMPPPTRPTTSLMPPPSVASSNLRPLSANHAIRVPSTGPLPNRGPQASNGRLGMPSSGPTVKTPNARGKVLLSPGHSPLDWASLQRSGKNLSGVDAMMRVTPSMLKEKNGRKGRPAWSSYQGKVYNMTPYLPFHPGGEGELKRAAGKDGTKLFMEVHPWVNWENMLGECMVGIMVIEAQPPAHTNGADLDDMD